MKKLVIAACAAFSSVVALASAVESSNVFGVLKVDLVNSSANAKGQYMIAVPWEAVGNAGTGINPGDLILASNLENDARLFAYGQGASGDQYGLWKVVNGAWVAQEIEDTVTGREFTTADAANVAAVRGKGLILETSSASIYLTGQYADAGSVTLASGENAYTLISGSRAEEFYLNGESQNVTLTPAAGDKVILTNPGASYTYVDGAWKTRGVETTTLSNGQQIAKETWVAANVVIPRGRAAWYVNGSGDANRTITFTAPNN